MLKLSRTPIPFFGVWRMDILGQYAIENTPT